MTDLEIVEDVFVERECTCEKDGKQKCLIHKVCIKCGHAACHCCGNWCDVILCSPTDKGNHTDAVAVNGDWSDNYPRMCCDGNCVYE